MVAVAKRLAEFFCLASRGRHPQSAKARIMGRLSPSLKWVTFSVVSLIRGSIFCIRCTNINLYETPPSRVLKEEFFRLTYCIYGNDKSQGITLSSKGDIETIC